MTGVRSVSAIGRFLPKSPTPFTSPSACEALPIQQQIMPTARVISGGTRERDEGPMVRLLTQSATDAVPERTGDWESVGQVIARLRR